MLQYTVIYTVLPCTFSTQAICNITKTNLGQPYYSPVALRWHCMWFAPPNKRSKPCVWATTCWIREAYVTVMNKKLCCGNRAWRPSFPPGSFVHATHLHNSLFQKHCTWDPEGPRSFGANMGLLTLVLQTSHKAGCSVCFSHKTGSNRVYLVSDIGRITTFYSKLSCPHGTLIVWV